MFTVLGSNRLNEVSYLSKEVFQSSENSAMWEAICILRIFLESKS